MTTHVDSVAHEHEALAPQVDEIRDVAHELPSLTLERRAERRDTIVDFLNGVLVPHAKAEEQGLYEQVATVLGHPEATAPMVYDHLAIQEWTAQLAEADPAELDRMLELLYGIRALVVEHFRKEEELYEPLLSRQETPLEYDAPVLLHEP